MGKSKRTGGATKREVGHAVEWKSSTDDGRVAPGAVLSPEASRSLQQDLAEIDEKQRSALVSGRTTYLGVKKR